MYLSLFGRVGPGGAVLLSRPPVVLSAPVLTRLRLDRAPLIILSANVTIVFIYSGVYVYTILAYNWMR